MKPGRSLASTGVLPNFRLRSLVAWKVSSEVASPGGLDQFHYRSREEEMDPTTLSGLLVKEAMRVMEMKRYCWPGWLSSDHFIQGFEDFLFMRTFSDAASMTQSQSLKSSRRVVVDSRPMMVFCSSALIFPF